MGQAGELKGDGADEVILDQVLVEDLDHYHHYHHHHHHHPHHLDLQPRGGVRNHNQEAVIPDRMKIFGDCFGFVNTLLSERELDK